MGCGRFVDSDGDGDRVVPTDGGFDSGGGDDSDIKSWMIDGQNICSDLNTII